MKKIFTLALLAAFALVGCNPDMPPQDGVPKPCDKHDVDYIMAEVSGLYYGNQYSESEDVYNYGLVLASHSDVYDVMTGAVTILPNSQYLFLDLYSTTPAKNGLSFKAPAGVYQLDAESTTAANTTGGEFTNMNITDSENLTEVFFTSGTVTVTDTLVEAILIATDGKVYHVQCQNKVVDNSDSYGNGAMAGEFSTLTGDVQIPFAADNSYIYAENYGDYLLVGKNLWAVYIDDIYTGDEVFLYVLADPDKAFAEGEYRVSGDLSKEGVLFGYVDPNGDTIGSWYYSLDLTTYDVVKYAPIVEGSVTFSAIADENCSVTVNVKDDLGHTISCSGAAYIEIAAPYSLSKLSTASKVVKHAKKALAPRKVKATFSIK